jgi:uncharacterized coiled-coil DUF342 family protein
MEIPQEKMTEIEKQLDALSEKAAKTDQRIAEVKEDVERVKEQADQAQRRLVKGG